MPSRSAHGTVGDPLAPPPGDRGAHSACWLKMDQAEAVLVGLSVGRAAGPMEGLRQYHS